MRIADENDGFTAMKNILTIDVEDWFHILDIESEPEMEEWDSFPGRLEPNFTRLLDILEETQAKSTCFFLGWIAKRYPHLVQEAKERGHEIASHGTSHRLVYRQSPEEFKEDIQTAKTIIEDQIQSPVLCYRAPGFSLTENTPWGYEIMAEVGYKYDSSVFPASRGHGGIKNAEVNPYRVSTKHGEIQEYPITVTTLFGKRYCFCGGGYFRLFPYWWIQRETRRLNRNGVSVVFYIHPRDIDPNQPRLRMNTFRHFKSYINLHSTKAKLRRLLQDFSFTSLQQWREDLRNGDEKP